MNPLRFLKKPLCFLLLLMAALLSSCGEEDVPISGDLWENDELEVAAPSASPQLGEGAFIETDAQLSERVVLRTTAEQVLSAKTIYRDTEALYLGQEQVQVQGKDGYCVVETEQVLIDGVAVSVVHTELARVDAVDTVILRGTRPRPVPTGIFRYPIRSAVTSYYGWRTLNGVRDFHYGIDLRAAVGTSIAASDGGVVVYAGTPSGISASYGKLIIIDHQNGYKTYYAHLSSFAVKVGDPVYQGQIIGKSGITGNITGPHLHFEIRKNNQTQDPLLYLQ